MLQNNENSVKSSKEPIQPSLVDIQLSFGPMVQINLPAALYRCSLSERPDHRLVIRLSDTEEIDWMFSDPLVGATGTVTFPCGTKKELVVTSSARKEGQVEILAQARPLPEKAGVLTGVRA